MLTVLLFLLVIGIFGYAIFTFASLIWMILDNFLCDLTDGALPLPLVLLIGGVCGIAYWIFF